ncbi:glutamate--cysteine ligase [Cellulomonas sp. NPDC089187]|uniref:carboxylate-amine ligase n=1 Tax=Cellulomonas sp. NPDC089187 TaxID=3154970 RepID=UPI003445BA00
MRTIGVEEEFLIVGPDGVPRAVAAAVLQHASAELSQDDDTPGGALEKEFAQEQVETSTHPCTDIDQLVAEVRAGRARADASAQHTGNHIVALATSPHAIDPTVVADARARRIMALFARTAQDQLTSGCHVHVSVADDAEGVRVIDHLRPWNPVLLAMSTNSPFWHGDDSGYQSFRSQIWGRWPTAGPTAPFGNAATYHRSVRALVESGTILDDGMVYFDARLSARYPTVEVRVADVCLDPEDAALIGALVRGLADTAVTTDPDPDPARTEWIRVAGWRAARTGLAEDLLSPLTGRPAPAGQVIEHLVGHITPALRANGDLDWVQAAVQRLLDRGTGADQQRQWRDAGADDRDVVARAVRSTLS